MPPRQSKLFKVLLGLTAAAALAACGEEGGDSGSSGTSGGARANVAAARAAIKPYVGKPSEFPVDEPLVKRPPAGSRFSYLQCVSPICALYGDLLAPAAKAMGVGFDVTKAEASSDALQSSAASILSKKPAAMMLPAVNAQQFGSALEKFSAADIPVTSVGVVAAEKYGIKANYNGEESSELGGKLLADWVIARKGDETNVTLYLIPELSFMPFVQRGFDREMAKNCPGCKTRSVDISIATLGNTAPTKVVSDLQSHPNTNVAVFGVGEISTGLPAALKTAGIKIDTLSNSPGPTNLQYIRDGQETAGLGFDFPVYAWTAMDITARVVTGQELTAGEKKSLPVLQFLEKKDITFDPAQGWTGYPDFPQRFTKLWSGAQ